MQMGVDGFNQFEIEFTNELEIAVHLFQDRIDDQRLAARSAGENISVSSRCAVEELTKDHASLRARTIHDMMES